MQSDAKFDNPGDAIAFARRVSDKAAQQEKRGDVGEAYQQTLEAWQALQPHLANTTCQSLSRELMADIERLGEQMSTNGVNVRGKPLKIK
ncbi:hypothetical protein [Aeoliella sp. SH292]|uniref:hypothetical protein n=1 Tax=Aeoliella sp. SH292 TaxID=3454464 RepID=UPI003F9687FF